MAREQDEGSPRGGLLLLAGAVLGAWALFKARRQSKEGSYLDFLAPPGTGRLAKELEANRAAQDQIVADAFNTAREWVPKYEAQQDQKIADAISVAKQTAHELGLVWRDGWYVRPDGGP